MGTGGTSTMPTITFDYNLADVAAALGSNFSAIWMIIAFVVGVSLCFRYAREIKDLFTS